MTLAASRIAEIRERLDAARTRTDLRLEGDGVLVDFLANARPDVGDLLSHSAALEVENAALRKALEGILSEMAVEEECGEPDCPDCGPWRPARAALAQQEGQT